MIRAFRYPLHPTRAQEEILSSWLKACCSLYNGAIQHRRGAWRAQKVRVTHFDQCVELTSLRAADPDWQAVPAWIARSALRRVDLAFSAFFRRVKTGQVPGFPRFRSWRRYDSFDLGSNIPVVANGRVTIPKLGPVKFHEYRQLRGNIKTVRIKHDRSGKWWVSFICDLGNAPTKISVHSIVGADVGLEYLVTLSTGERVENPRFYRQGEAILSQRQQVLARKKRGSSSRQRAKRLVARAHERVRNQRLDFARKLACNLFSRFDMVAHEDLVVSRMVHGTLAKSIKDAAWGQLLRVLACKAESAGKWCIPVDPRGTSQRCCRCGTVVKKALDEREHRCPSCGFVTHRDHNAALNIEALGLSVVQLTEADIRQGRRGLVAQ